MREGIQLSATTRYVIKYVFKTISRQKNSILEKLEEEFPRSMIDQYISFYSLRSWGQLQVKLGSPLKSEQKNGRACQAYDCG